MNMRKRELVDFPLNGKPHPAVVQHRKVMRNLRTNEIIFTSHQLLELLDDSTSNHFTKNYLSSTYGTNSGLSPHIPIPPRGIETLHLNYVNKL